MKKSSRHYNQLDFLLKLAGATRIELATSGVTGPSELQAVNYFNWLEEVGYIIFASFCNLCATIFQVLQGGVSPSLTS